MCFRKIFNIRSWTSSKSPKSSIEPPPDRLLHLYGDLVFDLCVSILHSPAQVQRTFKMIFSRLKKEGPSLNYVTYERAWVLKTTCMQLLGYYPYEGHQVSNEEQIRLDASHNVTDRLNEFQSYFRRLKPEDQILLLLRDKYGIPLADIAAALTLPEASLKVRRQHALRTLEDWLWNNS